MTAQLRRLQFPDTLLKQAGEIWFEHSDESLFIIAVEPDRFVFELLNPAHERRTGLRNADVSGRTPHECLPPAVADAVTEQYRSCVEAGAAVQYCETLDLPAGVKHWHTVLTPVRDGPGRISRIFGSARDVTVEHEALRREEDARRLMQQMIEASPDILYVYDLVVHRNAFITGRVREILGWSRDEIASMGGKVLGTLIHPEDGPAVGDHLARLRDLADHAFAEVEYRMRRPDGRYVWLRSRETVFQRGADGYVTRVFGAATSIQRYKETRTELISAFTAAYLDPEVCSQLDAGEAQLYPMLHFEHPFLAQMMLQLDRVLAQPEIYPHMYVESFAILLLSEIMAFQAMHPGQGRRTRRSLARGGLASWQLKAVCDYIHANLHQDISLAELAAIARLSPYHFCRAFKDTVGEPPHRYQMSRRIERAKALLADPSLSVSDVAAAAGYGSLSRFSAVFRQVTGHSPRDYRRRMI